MNVQWHVLGAGSIGSLFACALNEAGASPVLLSKNTLSTALSRTILMLQKTLDNKDPTSFTFAISPNSDTASIERLLVTTKAYDVHNAIRQVAHRLNDNSVIVILVNGMGFLAPIQQEFPHLTFTLGTTTEGAYRVNENHFCHAGLGITQIGQSGRMQAPSWFSSWSKLSLNCSWTANIDEILWQKLVINCAINPLTARHRCKNGDLALPERATEVNFLCDEIALVSRAQGYTHIADNIHQRVQDVIAATANNKSSMLQDTLAGRRTEIQYISRYFLECAAQHAVSTPLNAALCHEIQKSDQLAISAAKST
jgi:2-dehydropantoate 2-reductase